MTGDVEQRRDFTHVDDIVNGLYKISVNNIKHKDAWELGTGINYSINEVADMFDCETEYIPARPGEYDVTLCDYSKAEKYLDYNPKGNLRKYIKQWLEEIKNV